MIGNNPQRQFTVLMLASRHTDTEFPPPGEDLWVDGNGAFVIDSNGNEVKA